MRGATCVIVQTHQILRLPRKMTVQNLKEICWKRVKRHFQCAADPTMIRPWNRQSATRLATEVPFHAHHKHFVLKNATFRAPAIIPNFTEYCACHEKWHLNFTKYCACHEKWHLHFTKYCACHEKWPSRISKKFAENGWNVISNARPIREWSENDPSMIRAWSEHDPTMIRPWNRQSATRLATEVTFHAHHEHFVLKNTTFRAPAIIPNFTEYCACHEKWHSNFTKYCACHEKRISWLILVTHETLFTMRGATSVIVQTHQILRLPRKMNLMIDPWHKWNVIYNARSNMRHSPNSPNTAPATKNDRPESQRNLLKTDETSFPMRGRSENDPSMIRAWSEHDPTMIRPWSDHETVSPQPASQPRLPFTPTTSILYWKIQHFALRLSFQISPNTAPATKSDTWTSPNTAPATKSDTCTSPNTAPATKSDTSTSPNTAPAMKIELWLDWAMTWLSCDLTELWRDWAVTWLSYYWAVTWLSCDVTELWLDWAVTWLSCNLTELWRDWAVTWLAVTWLSCDLTELWLDWTVTWLSCNLTGCDLTELWLDWAVTWLSCNLTELWLDWAMTWLSCDLTETEL